MTLKEFEEKLDARSDRDNWRYIQKTEKNEKITCIVEHRDGTKMMESSWQEIWERVKRTSGGTR